MCPVRLKSWSLTKIETKVYVNRDNCLLLLIITSRKRSNSSSLTVLLPCTCGYSPERWSLALEGGVWNESLLLFNITLGILVLPLVSYAL